MEDISASIVVFVVMWVLHVLWFRILPPRTRVQSLVALFSIGVGLLAVVLAWSMWRSVDTQPAITSTGFPLTALVLYVLLSLAYIIVYTAVEVDSPSALIALLVHERGDAGMTYSDLREVLTDDNLVMARLRDLVAVGSVSAIGAQYRLERRGLLIARVFEMYRALLGRGLGG